MQLLPFGLLIAMKRNQMQQKPAFKLAFCAVIAALEVVLMLVTGLIPVGTYALPCFAGMLTIAVVIEFGCRWALGVFAVAAVLSLILSGDKEAALLFLLLFGYYPILKNVMEKHLSNPVLCWIIKLLLFNAAAVASFFGATLLLGVPASEFTLFGVYLPLVFLLIGNVFFVLYDLSILVFVRFYGQKLHYILFERH